MLDTWNKITYPFKKKHGVKGSWKGSRKSDPERGLTINMDILHPSSRWFTTPGALLLPADSASMICGKPWYGKFQLSSIQLTLFFGLYRLGYTVYRMKYYPLVCTSHCKDPYEPISAVRCHKGFVAVAPFMTRWIREKTRFCKLPFHVKNTFNPIDFYFQSPTIW